MKRYEIIIATLLIVLLVSPITNVNAQTDLPVVHAVLFYSPTCGHCEYVIKNTLLPMIQEYGDQLEIIGLDVTQQEGQILFLSAINKFNLESSGVPFLVIDDMYLIGSADIPEIFPSLVETHLARGGVNWPDIPGLTEIIAQSEEADTSTAAVSTAQADDSTMAAPVQSATSQITPVPATVSPALVSPTATPGFLLIDDVPSNWLSAFAHDPAGNTLSVFILLGMLGSIIWAVHLFRKTKGASLKENWAWIVPLFCVIGFGVAGYLAYVETTQTTAVCGPVGDCNTVQQSEYARLFGVLPIGILGLVGYVAIFISWLIARYTYNCMSDFAAISLFVMTAFGTLFSIYLTFLEPFVIGAACAWCLTSAILMTILMLLSVKPAKLAFYMSSFFTSHRRKHLRIGVIHD